MVILLRVNIAGRRLVLLLFIENTSRGGSCASFEEEQEIKYFASSSPPWFWVRATVSSKANIILGRAIFISY
jgi:hypothetical protein